MEHVSEPNLIESPMMLVSKYEPNLQLQKFLDTRSTPNPLPPAEPSTHLSRHRRRKGRYGLCHGATVVPATQFVVDNEIDPDAGTVVYGQGLSPAAIS